MSIIASFGGGKSIGVRLGALAEEIPLANRAYSPQRAEGQ